MALKRNSFPRRSFLKTSGLALGGAYGIPSMLSAFLTPGVSEAEAAEIAAVESGQIEPPRFSQAKPVWAQGREKEMNVTLAFVASLELDSDQASKSWSLRMTGSTIARVMVNGKLAGYGPARGPHGWFRVDEWKIGPFLQKGSNSITIEVAGYNSNSYYLLDQPSFLQAEVLDDQGNVIVATDTEESPQAFLPIDITGFRVQKVQRFSFQRPFIEVYNLQREQNPAVKLAQQPEVRYLARRVPYPEFAVLEPCAWKKSGTVTALPTLENPWRDRSITQIGPKLKGYPLDELEVILSDRIQGLQTTFDDAAAPKAIDALYQAGDVQIVDFGANQAGFFHLEVDSLEDGTELAITFDEILDGNGDVNFLRLQTCSAILWTLRKGSLPLMAFEPQVGRYIKLHCLKGGFRLKKCQILEYAYPAIRDAQFASSDARLEKLFRAGVLTFRENSVDAFTDCPHRERAGWLCDSFFTARTAFDLTGKTDVEDAFFENYLLPDRFEGLPEGMLPMCYPADHYDGVFIPNWSLWFLVELGEYAIRSQDQSVVNALKTKVEKLLRFFEKLENQDGLLEKLPNWVFVEWSAANDFVQDINYPSNMLYAAALEVVGTLYDNPAWLKKAEAVRDTIRKQSFDGSFFIDNALRKEDGSLEITTNRSEVCQYFAFFFRTATPETYPELWSKLLDEFGPHRMEAGLYPEIHKANSFVGNVLRLELLSQANRGEQLLEESVAYNEYMADRTGTLWEFDSPGASCNHGFASHLCRVMFRDVLGISRLDLVAKTLTICFQKFDHLDWAKGKQPLPEGCVELSWKKEGGKLLYSLSVPAAYTVQIENTSGLELVQGSVSPSDH